jgi:hypothetical protein
MPRKHVVQEGESLTTIAAQYGFADWKAIYQHAGNADLRKLRPNPHVLRPGDVVVVPDPKPREVSLATGKTHRVVVPRLTTMVNLVVEDAKGEPIAGRPFELVAEPWKHKGTTTGAGAVECEVPGHVDEADLVVWIGEPEKGGRYVWQLRIGALYPHNDPTGVRQRLNNLGYFAGDQPQGEDDGDAAMLLELAVRAFQEDSGLVPSGELDDETRDKLLEAHGGA